MSEMDILLPQLKRTIDDRKNYQKKKAVIDRANKAKASRAGRAKLNGDARADVGGRDDSGSESDEDEVGEEDGPAAAEASGSRFQGMSVDDFLGGGFKDGMDDEDDSEDEKDDEDEDALSELDDVSDGEAHAQDLESLKEKDPEFYKYLQENDQDLLDFAAGGGDDDDDDEDSDEEAPKSSKAKGKRRATDDEMETDEEEDEEEEAAATQQVVTMRTLRNWQKAMIQQRSLKALRKLLLAFRAAAHMDDPQEGGAAGSSYAFVVEEAAVFNKLLLTVLKYTPVVLQHHIPARETPQGKYKLPTNNKKFAILQRPIQTYFSNLHHLLKSLPEQKMVYVAATESAKMVPFLMNNRRMSREYVKIMLDLWATASDQVRVAAFLAVRKVAKAGDDAMLELCLRGAYQSLVRSTKLTTVHTLPSINLMKNSATELYALDAAASYQAAFGFIRQLAIHLRNALKTRSPDTLQSVYNWQYLHCVDFWSIVLSAACDRERVEATGQESELQQLIYPLVQVATGAVRLVPTSRYFPLRMHLLRSMLRLMQRTHIYVSLSPLLLEMIGASEFTRKAKGSTLKPLDLTTTLRAPTSYLKTRVYADQLAEEVPHLLLEFLATQSRSIAFPELVVPMTAQLRRTLKHGTTKGSSPSSAKLSANCKQILAKIDSNARFVETKRRSVDFAPNNLKAVKRFLRDGDDKSETPLEAALRLARKVREQKRKVVEMDEQTV